MALEKQEVVVYSSLYDTANRQYIMTDGATKGISEVAREHKVNQNKDIEKNNGRRT